MPKQKILIIESELANYTKFAELVSPHAIVKFTANSDETFQVIGEFLPDLVLLDIKLSALSGIEFCKKIRANDFFQRIKLILLSGEESLEDRLLAYQAGADDYVLKPYATQELVAKVEAHLRFAKFEETVMARGSDLEQKLLIRTEQLLNSEKAAFIGSHMSEIVHNLKNPLSILIVNINYLNDIYKDEIKLKSSIACLDRMHEIIKSILFVGRQSSDHVAQEIDLNELIKAELKLLESDNFFKYKVQATQALNEVPKIFGIPSQLSQSIGNLIKNAVEAMHGREKRELQVCTRIEETWIVLELRDTGCGIAKENLDKIFDPFFTTKPLQSQGGEPIGTGLGLASVHRMLMACGASVKFESVVDDYTLVTVKFPATCESAA